MRLKQNLVGINALERQIPKLRKDQEGKLLGGFAAIAGPTQPTVRSKGVTINLGCKEKCPCYITTPSQTPKPTTVGASNANIGMATGFSMLF